ncbi:MAG: isochorismatase family protein [Pirellulaceae bacterium]
MEALILVDLQHDFMPGGALGVPGGDEVLDVALEMSRRLQWVFATQDWHPAGHKSFASSHPGKQVGDSIKLNGLDQNLWPDHCVQGTRGAELVELIAALPLAAPARGKTRKSIVTADSSTTVAAMKRSCERCSRSGV